MGNEYYRNKHLLISTPSPISSLQENTAESISTQAFYAGTGSVSIVIFVVARSVFRNIRLREGEKNNE